MLIKRILEQRLILESNKLNSILTAKLLNSPSKYAGQKFEYDFRLLPRLFDERVVQKQCGKLNSRFSSLTKSWSVEKNSEWMCRHYLASKMILGATLQLNTLRYGIANNVRLTTSYLAYYSLLSLMRSVLLTSPEVDWNDGEIITATHSKIRNATCSRIRNFDKEAAARLENYSRRLKAWRELISYRSPTQGNPFELSLVELLDSCSILAECAQLQSELLERSVLKNSTAETHCMLDDYFDKIISVEIDGECFFDDEDWRRLGYIARKTPIPVNLLHMMTEGHVDDFFGAWAAEGSNQRNHFNPDEDWQIIFDIP